MSRHPLYDRGSLSEQTNQVFKALQQNFMSADELMNELELTKNELFTSLHRLEREHKIWRKQGRYRIVRASDESSKSDQ